MGTITLFTYGAALVALIVLQFVRAARLRRLVRGLNERVVGAPLSASVAHQLRLLHMPLPNTPADSLANLIQERVIYRRLTYACFLLLAVLVVFPFVAHRVWPVL